MTNQIGVTGVRSPEINAETFETQIITNTDTYEFIPMSIQIEPIVTNFVVIAAQISIGTNSPTYDNIVPLREVPDTPVIENIMFNPIKVPENTDIVCKMSINSNAQDHRFRVLIAGMFIP